MYKPLLDFRSSLDDRRYGATTFQNCIVDGIITKETPADPENPGNGSVFETVELYRPADDSIMNNKFNSKFNIISCGYVITAIKRERLEKSNAEKYWPECLGLDTVKDGIQL